MSPDEEAELCAEHFDWVVRYSQNYARKQMTDQFADCESDALLGMLLAIRSWDPEGGAELTQWIRSKVFHQMVDGLRERLGRVVPKHQERLANFNAPLDLHFQMIQADTPGITLFHELIPEVQEHLSEFERVELVADLSRVVPCLTEKQRRILGAVFWEQKTQAEHAAQQGVTESASSHLMKNTLKKIRKSYAQV
jgi:RNA polymerase sigma factor (sigma-70 family)